MLAGHVIMDPIAFLKNPHILMLTQFRWNLHLINITVCKLSRIKHRALKPNSDWAALAVTDCHPAAAEPSWAVMVANVSIKHTPIVTAMRVAFSNWGMFVTDALSCLFMYSSV